MPFKPLSNALLNPYKAPFGTHLCNYLITKNLRRSLINSFLTHFPTFSLHFCQYISRGDGCWVLGGEWWVLMVSIKFIVNPHIINTQHPTFNPTHHQHPTFNTHHPTPNISHPINFIISFFLCKFAVK